MDQNGSNLIESYIKLFSRLLGLNQGVLSIHFELTLTSNFLVDSLDWIRSNWIKLDQNGSKWVKKDQNGSNWIKMDFLPLHQGHLHSHLLRHFLQIQELFLSKWTRMKIRLKLKKQHFNSKIMHNKCKNIIGNV